MVIAQVLYLVVKRPLSSTNWRETQVLTRAAAQVYALGLDP